ncbi:MAG: orotidine-5'-phosphate decarboxylase [Gemmatimonadaceae bacterium]|nr:orotidine-5'-phosphate decarboxylase [Gemmatimonadaceae bacterium]
MADVTQPTLRATPVVALDYPDLAQARVMVDALGASCDFYKVGLELYAADGPRVLDWLRAAGKRVFVDLKAYDIPNTVRGVARSVAAHGASLLTVHAAGGARMLEAAVDGAGGASSQDGSGCGILAVTVLTSFSADEYAAAAGKPVPSVEAEVLRLADVAARAGCHGIVCSGEEVAAVRSSTPALWPLVPGVRLAGGAAHDQSRVVTPRDAAARGARYVVLGRAVTAATDPRAAMAAVLADLAE